MNNYLRDYRDLETAEPEHIRHETILRSTEVQTFQKTYHAPKQISCGNKHANKLIRATTKSIRLNTSLQKAANIKIIALKHFY